VPVPGRSERIRLGTGILQIPARQPAAATAAATLEKKLAAYETAGVDTLIVTPFGDREAVLEALAGTR
jgi:hypothetical protein